MTCFTMVRVVTRSKTTGECSTSATQVDTSVISPVSDQNQNVMNSNSDVVETVTSIIDDDNCDQDLLLLFKNSAESTTLPMP